jgi:hypothetical protein
MRKIAIFAEGQSEQIFVRHFLALTLGWEKISFQCLKLYADSMLHAPFDYKNEHAEVHFLIVNVGNDERVLSAIKEREVPFLQKGYEKIIGLRDMYSKKYSERSSGRINENVTRTFIESADKTIEQMSEPERIKMLFAIMELEAWFLGMYNVFKRLNSTLTVDYIESKLDYNLSAIDPQTIFFRPSDIVDSIFSLIGERYKKSDDQVESICCKIDIKDFHNAFEGGRCESLKKFYEEMQN